MTKIELTNVVEVAYWDKNDVFITAMVQVPEESLPPMSEEDKKYGIRSLDIYFSKATEILKNEIGPIKVYEIRFMGKNITVIH